MRRRIRNLALALVLVTSMLTTTSCFVDQTTLVNVATWSMSEVDRITLSYDTDNITLLESPSDEIVIKEYASKDDSRYYATITEDGSALSITGGLRPDDPMFASYVELYLPDDYTGAVAIGTGSGVVVSNISNDLSSLAVVTTDGTVTVNGLSAGSATVRTDSGAITMSGFSGTLEGTTVSGNVKIASLDGAAVLSSQSGTLELVVAQLDGTVKMTTDSARIKLKVPEASRFAFSATTSSGSIRTPFDEDEITSESDNAVEAAHGTSPTNDVVLHTSSAAITVDYS